MMSLPQTAVACTVFNDPGLFDKCLIGDVEIVTALHETLPFRWPTAWEDRGTPLYRGGRLQDEATIIFSG